MESIVLLINNNYEFIIVFLFILFGMIFLYKNRKDLLYEDGYLSLGRIWGWGCFTFCCIYWIRMLVGILPQDTKIPDGLMELLYASLAYNLGKYGIKGFSWQTPNDKKTNKNSDDYSDTNTDFYRNKDE
jgi:hypothetical protein